MMMAAAGSVRSERWNVITLIPLARQRESSSCPNVPCERRTDPAKPPGTHPRRQPPQVSRRLYVRVDIFV